MKMKHLKDASQELTSKLIRTLEHAVLLKKDGIDPMIPFAFVYNGENETIKSFVGDTPEYADKMFEKTILEESPDYVIYGYDGYLTVEENKTDTILIKAYDKIDDVIYLVAQRFIPKDKNKECEIVGNPVFLGTEENILLYNKVEKTDNNIKVKNKPWWKFR